MTEQVMDDQIFILSADTLHKLQDQVLALEKDFAHLSLEALARHLQKQYASSKPLPHRICLIASTQHELHKEIQWMVQGFSKSSELGKAWRTPKGSCLVLEPYNNPESLTAFVYPGMGSAYPNLGKKLFSRVPSCFRAFDEAMEGLAKDILQYDLIYPEDDRVLAEETLNSEVWRICAASLSFSWLYTFFLRQVCGISPRYAIGYSIGEAGMVSALGAWTHPAQLFKQMHQYSTFFSGLTGAMDSVKAYWQDQGFFPSDATNMLWKSFLLKVPVSTVMSILSQYPFVYLMAIHTDHECMIGGYADDCEKIINTLHATAIPVPYAAAFHSAAIAAERQALECICSLTTAPIPQALYTSATYTRMDVSQFDIARNLAQSFIQVVDFPKLVNLLYEQGARVFIEVGGRNNCSYWIQKILTGKSHISIPCNIKGVDDWSASLRALSQMIAHGLSPKIDWLYGHREQRNSQPMLTVLSFSDY